MPGSPPRSSRRTLFVTVLSLFLAVALLVATAVTVTNYIETGKTAVKVADDTFRMTINRINEQRVAFFTPAFLLTNVLRNAPSFQTADGSKDAIRQLILTSLRASPQISAVYVGYDNGNFFHILSITESEKTFVEQLGGPPLTRFVIHEIRTDNNGARVQTWLFLDSDNRQIGTLSKPSPEYDPRSRDWYRDAMENPKTVVRTLPYLFSATSQVGMTLAQALEHGGVVGVDITLERLMIYIRSIRPNDTHRFVAFDDKNRLLAHFDSEKMFKPSGSGEARSTELATTADLSDPVVEKAFQLFTRSGPYRLATLDVGGTDYLATVDRQIGRDGGAFFQLYAAPLSDFQGTLAGAAGRSIPIALLVFLLTLPAIVYLARSISQPLFRLAKEAELDSIVPARRPDQDALGRA